MSRHRSAAKLVNMSGKQTYDDIVNFLCNESKMNHIVIKLQIMNNPLIRLMRSRWNTNLYIFYLYFRWWLSFRRSTPAAHNLLLRWEATRFFLKCMPLHTSYLYISWNRRIWETTSFWRYADLYSPKLSRSIQIKRHFVLLMFYL